MESNPVPMEEVEKEVEVETLETFASEEAEGGVEMAEELKGRGVAQKEGSSTEPIGDGIGSAEETGEMSLGETRIEEGEEKVAPVGINNGDKGGGERAGKAGRSRLLLRLR